MKHSETESQQGAAAEPLAIIGMACLFPKADGLSAYWANIRHGVDGITEVPPTHWSVEDYFHPDPKKPDFTYCRRGGFLPPTTFDPLEFGITPNTLEAIDTSQLLALVVAQEALKDAGYDPNKEFDRRRVSVILGVTGTLELVIPLGARLGHPIWRKALAEAGIEGSKAEEVVERIAGSYVDWQENSFPGLLGNVVAGRIANRFNLGGTNCAVDAACGSSLSAIHMASLELISGRSNMVITGGVDAFNDIFMYMCFSKTPALSPTGDSRPFDSQGDGTILGEGIGMVVLKRLVDAQTDGNRIYAVLKGIGTSSDGRGKSIYAPNSEGQKNAIQEAYRLAGVTPDTIELVEGHGTGTKVGDAVEASGLIDVYKSASTGQGPWCALGSVKSQIGHTKAAAGVAGMIKAALALHHKVLPPTLKIKEPLPLLTEADSPIYLNVQERPWISHGETPRRAAVSAFGFGGSNFHALLEEYRPQKTIEAWDGSVQIISVSGRDVASLVSGLRQFGPGLTWDEIRVEAWKSRQAFNPDDPARLALVVEEGNVDLIRTCLESLSRADLEDITQNPNGWYVSRKKATGLAILFAGQGSQYVGMGRDLVCQFPRMHAVVERASEAWTEAVHPPRTGRLADLIFPRPAWTDQERDANDLALRATQVAQPAIGAIGLGMFRILETFGVKPDAVAGHSYGELLALCVSGRLTEEELHRLSRTRGELMAQGGSDRGAMLAVKAPSDELERIISAERLSLTIANRNAPEQTVLAGPTAEIERAKEILKAHQLKGIRLPVSAAFHSALVAEARTPFREALVPTAFTPGQIPVFANSTGACYPTDPEEAKDLLAGQLARPVEFVKMIEAIHDSGVQTFVEVGPQSRLTPLVGSILKGRPHHALALDSSAGKRSGSVDLARVLAQLAVFGYPVDLNRWEDGVDGVRKTMERRKPKLPVALSGANYRSPQPEKTKPRPVQKPFQSEPCEPQAAPRPSGSAIVQKDQAVKSVQNERPLPSVTSTKPAEKSSPPASTRLLSEALRASQESLAALAKHQEQVGHLHEQFLKGQESAQRTFQTLVEHQQSLFFHAVGVRPAQIAQTATTAAPMDWTAPSEAPHQKPFQTIEQPAPAPAVSRVVHADPAQARAVAEPVSRAADVASDVAAVTAGASATGQAPSSATTPSLAADIVEIARSIVSEKTGYPTEMLKLEMDMESDLGIDSIKRVEIFSALQDQLPDAPAVKPEHMGTLKTLGQIVEFLSQGSSSQVAKPAAGSSQPATSNTAATTSGNSGEVETILLRIVAEKTGYPTDMLKLEMDMESDLGIDSIKRVEILSALQDQLPEAPVVKPEHMGTLKTLGHIVSFLSGGSTGGKKESEVKRCLASQCAAPSSSADPTDAPVELDRSVLTVRSVDGLPRQTIQFQAGNTIWVADGGSDLGPAIIERLAQRGLKGRLVALRHATHQGNGAPVGGLIIVAPRRQLSATGLWEAESEKFLKDSFLLAQQVGPSLRQEGRARGAFFVTISRLDGAFGTANLDPIQDPTSGGLAGLAKTVAREWPEVHAKALDVDFSWTDAAAAAKAVCDEIFVDGPVEVGLSSEGAISLELTHDPLSPIDRSAANPKPWNAGDVVVLTGGARGVTADVAVSLARAFHPTLVLLGRTPAPEAEPEWLTPLTDEAAIKKALLAHSSRKLSPKDLETEYRRRLSNREVMRSLARVEAAGSRAVYWTVDVRDLDAVRKVMDRVRAEFGPVRGLVHGAGVLQDRLISDKSLDQFETVFDTKVVGLRVLLETLRQDDLKAVVLFSSVSGRYGRSGQVDYSMANEVMNKVARHLAAARPECHTLAVNWGPWDGGMVTASLKRVFQQEGVGIIPLKDGAEYLVSELLTRRENDAEVVITGHCPAEAGNDRKETTTRSFAVAFERDVDLARYPFLKSHVLGGRPVLPLAMIGEWLAHAALHTNPGLHFHGLNDLRVLKGVILNEPVVHVNGMVGRTVRDGELFRVPVELRGGENRSTLHASASVILATRLPQPNGAGAGFEVVPGRPYPCTLDEAYESLLFHGMDLRGIERITGCQETGISAWVKPAPTPTTWIAEPLRDNWVMDPLVLDAAFQLMILWSIDQHRAGCLPCHVARYRQFRVGYPTESVLVTARIVTQKNNFVTADILFTDRHEGLIARMNGFEATIDPQLKDAFQRRTLGQRPDVASPAA